jgi:hypothetical protein
MADSAEAALDTVANEALPKAGGTVSGPLTVTGAFEVTAAAGVKVGGLRVTDNGGGFSLLESNGNNVRFRAGATALQLAYGGDFVPSVTTLDRQTQAGDAANSLVTKGYVDARGTWSAWTPTLTAATTNPTSSAVANSCRFVRNGNTVIGKGVITVTAAGSGQYRIPLPVTPRATSANARRIGTLQIDAGGRVQHFMLGQVNGQEYCSAVLMPGSTQESAAFLDGTRAGVFLALGATTISFEFTFEAA